MLLKKIFGKLKPPANETEETIFGKMKLSNTIEMPALYISAHTSCKKGIKKIGIYAQQIIQRIITNSKI